MRLCQWWGEKFASLCALWTNGRWKSGLSNSM